MDKYNRNYELSIQRRDGRTLTVRRPFTIEFDIHRNSMSSANTASFRIYNLSTNNRNLVRKNQFDYGDFRRIDFKAGYGDQLAFAFSGNITQAWSTREGTDMVTQIECFDAGFAYVNAITSNQFTKGTPVKSIIESLISSMPGVKVGAIGDFPGSLTRGASFSGSTIAQLKETTGGSFFIDGGQAHCLNDNECLDGVIPLINAQSGLLGTPTREQQFINLEMLFEPGIAVAQQVQVESSTGDESSGISGIHKVLSIKHRGTISDAVSGNAVTTLGLLPGTFIPVRKA